MEFEKKIMQHAASLYAICYSEKLDLVFTGGADNVVASWNPATFENTDFTIKTNSTVVNLQIINESQLFIGLFNGDIHIIDLDQKKEIKYITHHKKGIYASLYDVKSNRLVIGSGDGMLTIWDCENYELLLSQEVSTSKIRAVEIQDSEVYIGTAEGVLYVINIESLQLQSRNRVNDSGINSLCILPEKNAVLVGGKDAHIYVFNLEKNTVVLDIAAHNWAIYKMLIIDGKLYSCSRDKTIKQWNLISMDVEKRYCYPEFKGHTHSINNMVYVQKYNYLVSVGDDKAICYWRK